MGLRIVHASLMMLVAVAALSCAHTIPLNPAHAVQSPEQLHERMRASFSSARSLSCDMDFRAFAEGQRLRSSAVLLVQQPANMRLDIFGPHGGVLQAFAMNDERVVLLDMKESRALTGPPSAATLDALLPVAALGLPPQWWTEMLLGRLPDELLHSLVQLYYDKRQGFYVLCALPKHEGDGVLCVKVEPSSGVIREALRRVGGKDVWRVGFGKQRQQGIPLEIRVQMASPRVDTELRLRDVEVDSALSEESFVLNVQSDVPILRIEP